ncbi:MAG: hypothetical protein ACOYOA_10500 [Saprospiraceae bacterium]
MGAWANLSTGLNIRQFYTIGCSKTDSDVIVGGAQDNNGTFRQSNGTFVDWIGGDGGGVAVSPTNPNLAIGTYVYGDVYKTTDAGATSIPLAQPDSGAWVTPVVFHPTNGNIVYVGWHGVYRSDNLGASWTRLSTISGVVDELAVSPSNPNYIYYSSGAKLWRTSNGGSNWTQPITLGNNITSICVSPIDPKKIWITTAAQSNNVWVSVDSGSNLADISSGLPSPMAARSIVVDDSALEGIYLGMNVGVYYRDNTNPQWIEQATGLPLVAVNALDLQLSSQKVRVATYGRGIWESDMQFNVSIGADVTLNCGANSKQLEVVSSAVTSVSYIWSTGQTTANITVAPSATTTYRVTATNVNGASAVDEVIVHVASGGTSVVANAGPDKSLTCSNPSATLTASGGTSYKWSTGATSASITVGATSYTGSPGAGQKENTTYSVTVSNASGCSAVDEAVVTSSFYVFKVGCSDSWAIGCSGAVSTSYLWSTGATTSLIDVSPSVDTWYSLTATSTAGSVVSCYRALVETAGPTVSAGPDDTVDCINPSATLTASGGAYYLWSTGQTGSTITVSPLATTTYSVTVTATSGCAGVDQVIVYYDAHSVIANAGPDVTVNCNSPDADLTASGGTYYLWSNGQTGNSITVSPLATTTYSVTVTASSGCSAVDQVTVFYNVSSINANAGPDMTVSCSNPTATLTATGGSTYYWSTGQFGSSITVSPSATTTYSVTITASNGCTGVDQVTVFNNGNNITANAGPDVTVNCNNPTATLTASGGTIYLWSTGANTPSITVSPSATTTYSVTVSSGNCSANDQVVVYFNASTLNANAGPDKILTCSNPTVTLTASGGTSFKWSTGATTASIAVGATPYAGSAGAGQKENTAYIVTVSTSGACSAVDTVMVTSSFYEFKVGCNDNWTIGCSGVAATTYLWSTGATTSYIDVSSTTETWYFLTATTAAGSTVSCYKSFVDGSLPGGNACSVVISPKVFLNNVNTSTLLMDNYISHIAGFPLSDPYSAAPLNTHYTHVNNSTVASMAPGVLTITGSNAIVDWVFLELRAGSSGSTTVVSTKAALLQRDGDIVSTDGVSAVTFNPVSPGNYFLAVRHRNNLGFRTLNTYALSGTNTSFNFTNSSIPLYGSTPRLAVSQNLFVMNGGDATADGSVDALDTVQWESQNGLFDDYSNSADYDVDGSVDSIDSITWEINNGKFEELD